MLLDTAIDITRSSGYNTVSDAVDIVDFTDQIDAVAAVISSRLGHKYTAILLIGAAARGEQTLDPIGRLASDLDFLIVLPQRHPAAAILAERQCRVLLSGCEAEMPSYLKGAVSIGFASSSPHFWRLASPSMYELRRNARCLYGLSAVLDWPRINDPRSLPAWEGIRLVANRLCEMFGALEHYHHYRKIPGMPDLPDSALTLRYATVKQALACSEAALIFSGEYRPTYRERFSAHTSVAHLFTHTHNAFIGDSYSAKLGAFSPIFDLDPDMLVQGAVALALHTLALVGASTPTSIASLTRRSAPAAPGIACDLLFFARQSIKGDRVPARRAISSVYSDAIALAHRLVAIQPLYLPLPMSQYRQLIDTGGDLYRRYKGSQQVVGTI